MEIDSSSTRSGVCNRQLTLGFTPGLRKNDTTASNAVMEGL
jgi:hypothetical protein